MKRVLISLAICFAVTAFAALGLASDKKPKAGPITGTWECTSHGSSQGDMPFTLYLEQNKEVVTGSVSSPMGGTDITSATYKKKILEIHIDTPQANYVVMGKLKGGQLSGTWSAGEEEKGTWEGKKGAPAAGK